MWAPDYITVEQAKATERIGDDVDDDELAVDITSACRAIDDHCNRQFGALDDPEERAYTAWYDYDLGRWRVDIDDLQDSAELVITIGGVAVTDYILAPANAVKKGKAWEEIIIGRDAEAQPCGDPYEVLAEAPWGWTVTGVPVPVTKACRLQTSRFAARRESPYGVVGSPQQGSELRLLTRVDPDVAVALRGFRRTRKVG
jgi:hypothetical protein